MVEMTPDPIVCRCGRSWDRNVYAQCPFDGEDLWEMVVRDEPSSIAIATAGTEFTIDAGAMLPLGRDRQYPTAAALDYHANVSRYHALLRFDGKRLFVTDTASTNGTFVDDLRLPAHDEHEVLPGQALRLAADVTIDVRWRS